MKKRFLLFLTFLLLCSTVAAYAAGSGNVDTGGGGMGTGSGGSGWNSNEYGVRISVIRKQGAETVACFDWSSCDESNVQVSFGKTNKIQYKFGHDLVGTDVRYASRTPSTPLPVVVSSRNGGGNAAAIKRYFTDTGVLIDISSDSGVAYDDLIGGDYAILLEPMAYYKFRGVKYATTATEAAKLDLATSGKLYYDMWSLTHQNLPLAMFLERDEETALSFGLHKWTGAKTGKRRTMICRSEKCALPQSLKRIFSLTFFRRSRTILIEDKWYLIGGLTPKIRNACRTNVPMVGRQQKNLCPCRTNVSAAGGQQKNQSSRGSMKRRGVSAPPCNRWRKI